MSGEEQDVLLQTLAKINTGAAPGVSSRQDAGKALLAADRVKLQRTKDGDTLEGSHGREVETFRLAGIDAPESAQKLGPEAQAYLDELAAGAGDEGLKVGSRVVDRHGRTASVLLAGDKNVNVEMVRAGHARAAYLEGLPKKLRREFRAAEDEARAAGRGVWGQDAPEDPAIFRMRARAVGGEAAMSAGHERRPRVDEGQVQTPQESLFGALARIRGGGGRFSGAGATGVSGGSPSYKGKGTGTGAIGQDVYQKEDGWLEHVLGGLDYPRNVTASLLAGILDGQSLSTGWKWAKEAAAKERFTSSTHLKDSLVREATGGRVGKLRFGKDDGKFQFGDVADAAVNLGLDVVTDPLSWVTWGANSLGKGTGAVARALAASRMGKPSVVAAGGRAAVGALLGAGVPDEDASFADRALAAAAGAGAGVIAGPALARAGKFTREELFDRATNAYAKATRGSSFKDFAVKRLVALDSYDKVQNIAEWIRQGRLEALDGLAPADKLRASKLMEDLKTETIRFRNDAMEKIAAKPGTPEYQAALDDITRAANQHVEQNVLPELVRRDGEQVQKAITAWADHNDAVIKKLNNMTGKDVVGLRFHIDDVYKEKDLAQAAQGLSEGIIHQAKAVERSGARDALGHDTSYAIYAEKFANKFLTRAEREAQQIMREYKAAELNPLVKGFEATLHTTDKLTNFIKGNMLYFSMSWLKNNYFDNVAKAFVENGLAGLMDHATARAYRSGLRKDVWALYKGNTSLAYKTPLFKDALNLGVLDNPMFKSMTDELTRDFLFRPSAITQANDKTLGRYILKAQNVVMSKNPVASTMAQVGSYVEGTARFMTFQRTYEAMKANPAFKEVKDYALKQMAADVVKKTFFDYGNVTAFEAATFKRLVPFYSFYSKNLPYWAQATFDPARVGRVAALEHARRSVGREPTAGDKAGMTPYVLGNAPRKLGKTAKGETEYVIVPAASHHDAAKMLNPAEWKDQAIEKGNPLAKLVYELASGNDLFTGDKLYPSDQPQGKKFLFSRGAQYYPFLDAVKMDDRGNPYTTSDQMVVGDKIFSTLLPHAFVDQVAGGISKVATGKSKPGDVLIDRLTPWQDVKISPEYARMVRARKEQQ